MELNNNIKNNKNFNLKNSSLNEESQKEIIKGNQTNLKKNNIINRRNKNNNLLNNINDNNNNPIEYGKIFGLLNHEIKEIEEEPETNKKKIKPKYTKPYEQEEEELSEKPTKEKMILKITVLV